MEISSKVCFELSCKTSGLNQETTIYPTKRAKTWPFYVNNSELLKQIREFCAKLQQQKPNEQLNMHLVRIVNIVANGTGAEVAPSMRIVDQNSVFDFVVEQNQKAKHTGKTIVVDENLNQIWPPKIPQIGPRVTHDDFSGKPDALMAILNKKTADIKIR